MSTLPVVMADKDPEALLKRVAELPCYDINTEDGLLLQALMRDYSILTSAYILEGLEKSKFSDKNVKAPRTVVPKNIAIPFNAVCRLLKEQSIMSYDSYCLSNCMSVLDPEPSTNNHEQPNYASTNWHWENLRLIRAFDGGPEEATFVLIHSEIESHTPKLIKSFNLIGKGLGYTNGLTGAIEDSVSKDDEALKPSDPVDVMLVKDGLIMLKETMEAIVVSQLKMFNASNPKLYITRVRPWIFGWKGNPDLPDGVIFDGVNDNKPTFLRGETGAQSTIIPSMDVVLGVTHKRDALREMLAELEAFRPNPQCQWLSNLRKIFWGEDAGAGLARVDENDASTAHLLKDTISNHPDANIRKELEDLLCDVTSLMWSFRDIHVTFADLYIARFTDRALATGGSPFKAYLRKHRAESEVANLRFHLPTTEVFNTDLDNVLKEEWENGIPNFLLERHADIIAKYGQGSESLKKKKFPTAKEISKWDIAQ